MMSKIHIFVIILCVSLTMNTRPKFSFNNPNGSVVIEASLYYNETTNSYKYVEGVYDTSAVAYAKYSPQLEKVGWDFLTVSSNLEGKYSNEVLGYGFGYIEGVLTRNRIYPYYLISKSAVFGDSEIGENVIEYFNLFDEAVANQSLINSKNGDPYWTSVYNTYNQFLGMLDGYNEFADEDKKLSIIQLHVIVSGSDISDIQNYLTWNQTDYLFSNKKSKPETHCSSLFKSLDNLSDVIFGHNTWYDLTTMMRIFKEYRFQSQNQIEKSRSVLFSSYPGCLTSTDDFYITDSNLVITETSFSINNLLLYKALDPTTTLLYWIRNIVANRLATDAESWTEIFSRYNSGTYNNQFMILDMNKVDLTNQIIHDGAFWISEQLPGIMKNQDLTDVLRFGYWPSYNLPYSQEIFRLTLDQNLTPETMNKTIASFSNTPRANIFRRDQGSVTDVESFMKLIRSNNYKTDPLSLGKPYHAISSRQDLPSDNQFCWGGLDSKVGSVKSLMNSTQKTIPIISGPTHENEPIFVLSESICNQDGLIFGGVPNVWNFGWIDYETILFE